MFRIQGLDPSIFADLIGLSDTALSARGVTRHLCDAKPGFPDRIALRDLEIGETAVLLNDGHQPADTPYRSRHAIVIGERSSQALDLLDAVPEALRIRPISLRAFDDAGRMVDADLVDGSALIPPIERLLRNPNVAYPHAHYTKHGCYAARIVRA